MKVFETCSITSFMESWTTLQQSRSLIRIKYKLFLNGFITQKQIESYKEILAQKQIEFYRELRRKRDEERAINMLWNNLTRRSLL